MKKILLLSLFAVLNLSLYACSNPTQAPARQRVTDDDKDETSET